MPTPPFEPDTEKRIRERMLQSEQYLADAGPTRRAWARAHLFVANQVDRVNSLQGNEAFGAIEGGLFGIIQGGLLGLAVYGLLLAGGVVPSVVIGAAVVGGVAAVNGVRHAINAYHDTMDSHILSDGAHRADQIAAAGHAISPVTPRRSPDAQTEKTSSMDDIMEKIGGSFADRVTASRSNDNDIER